MVATDRASVGFARVSALLAAAVICAASLAPTEARAQVQTAEQQACLNALYKAGAKLGKSQGKAAVSCIKYAQKLQTDKLGGENQEQTVDACLTNDTKGKLAKGAAGVAAAETKSCGTAPSFGTGGAARVAGAASSQSRALLRDFFGANIGELVLYAPAYDDAEGAACHTAVTAAMGKLYDTFWKETSAAAKAALAGKDVPQVTSGAALGTAILAALDADAKGKIAKSVTKLTETVAETCGATSQPLTELIRGECSGSGNAAQLSACLLAATRCRTCRAIQGATDIALDCDDFDDGAANQSCADCASARLITQVGELITGPLADGQLGDYLMENEAARFIIQKPAVRDIYSVGGFGGNLIDAELVGNPGMDNFLEMQPAINIETVINAETLEVVNDGADCGPAIIRTCGPDDVLDFVNASIIIEEAGLSFPPEANDNDQEVEGCTEYILEPDAAYLKLVTTMFNNEAPAACNDDTDCTADQVCIDGSCALELFVGDYVNAAGEVEQWGSGNAGIGIRLIADDMGVLSYYGYGQAEGVDYGITTIEIPESTEKTGYFSTSGVSYILHSQSVLNAIISTDPKFEVAAGASKSFTRYFGVGDGSGGNAISLENIVKAKLSRDVSGCVTVAGVDAPGARVSVGPVQAGAIARVTSTWVAGPDGCYAGTVPVLASGTYGVAAWREGTPYEGGGATPTIHTFPAAATTPIVQDIDLPSTGTLSVTVVDENSDPVPGRVSVVGFDPSPDIVFPSGDNTGLHRDQEDVHPFGVTRAVYTDATGAASFDVEPGSYRVYVSRGSEYSLFDQAVTITAGATSNVSAQIAHVIDTTGFISSDHHVHGIASADSRVSEFDRVHQFAGEGVDNVIMTDHHAHTDLNPSIASLGFSSFLTSTIGEEVTTWDTGHYNAYPLTIDPTRPSGGSTDWGGAAPIGEDFPSLGSYILEPSAVDALAKTGSTSTPDTIVQINHISSHFVPLEIDTSQVPPQSTLSPARRLDFRMDPNAGNPFHHFEALELWNGNGRSHQSQFLNERIGIWFNHLNQGLITTHVCDTDTHKFANLESAGARTWAASSFDDPPSISPAEMTQSIRAGKAVGGQGLYVQARLVDAADAGNVADLTLGGSTLLTASNPVAGVNLEVDVQAPVWADFDRILIYANAATAPVLATPQLFTATPTMTLNAPANFTITTNNVFPLVTGGSRKEASVAVNFPNMTADTWFVVVVKGTDGVSRPMFPVFPADLQKTGNTTLATITDGNLGQSGVTSLGFTNALYADVDGTPGFDAPLAP